MCTVSWWRSDADTYGVFFNRDERRTRPGSLAVVWDEADDGTPYLAPRDPAAGGTWLMANARGLVAGVLNHYAAEGDHPPGRRSRGELPLALVGCRDRAAAASVLAGVDWADFAPCILLVWDGAGESEWLWDGTGLRTIGKPSPPLTTSSHRTEEVRRWRRARYREYMQEVPGLRAREGSGRVELPGLLSALSAFHHDASHPDGAFNVRMRRPDARTESICRVEVTRLEVRFVHQRESPDALAMINERELFLRRV